MTQSSPQVMRGIMWMVAATFFSAAGNAQARHLAENLHPLQVVCFSTLGAVIWMLPWAIRRGIKKLKTMRGRRYGFRAVLELAGWASAYKALTLLPLPDYTALAFLQPLLTSTAAVIIFRERTTHHTWIAFAAGTIGVYIVLRPDMASYQEGFVYLLVAVLCFSACGIIIKTLARTESPATITFYMLFFTGLLALPLAVAVWQAPAPALWPWLLLVGLTMTMTQFCVSHAIAQAPLTAILPFSFCGLLFSAFFAYLFFDEVITGWTLFGGVVILGSAVYALYFTRRASRREDIVQVTQQMVEP